MEAHLEKSGHVDLKQEIEAAKRIVVETKTEVVSGQSVSLVLRKPEPGYTLYSHKMEVLQTFDSIEVRAARDLSDQGRARIEGSARPRVRIRANGQSYEERQ